MSDGGQYKPGTLEFVRYAVKNMNVFRAVRARDRARARLYLTNMAIGKMGYGDPAYVQRVREYDQAMIEYYKGKWYATLATRTRRKEDWQRAFAGFKNADRIAGELSGRLKEGTTAPVPFKESLVEDRGTEIKFADGVPMVPEITPVVILQGSDYEMGYQYAQQLVQIYGKWILERHAGKEFSARDREVLRTWEKQHAEHTPWLIDFCRGWADGASTLGISMSYDDVLDLWVGHKPPAKDYLDTGGLPELPRLACSGVAAWGRATNDGKLITGSTGDHDLSYQITIVAFPDKGNSFIYSPFGATGDIAGLGGLYFFGHPAINDKGLAYVHHGGGPKYLDARKHWGYGIRRAASVMHILRFCSTAREARAMEEAWPIGDVGLGDYATVGGFYADGSYGYVIEGRKDPAAIREAGMLGETDFIYANNSAAHPDAIESEWMREHKDEWTWDEHGGWRPKKPTGMTKSIGFLLAWFSGRFSASDTLRKAMMFTYTNSCNRNRYFYRRMTDGFGRIDLEYMKTVFRIGGTIPEGSWDQIVKAYEKEGTWGEISTGHASNAMTVVAKPGEGLYCMCTGPATRGLAPMMPSAAIPIYRETNAFWEIKLASTPGEVVAYSRDRAVEDIRAAKEAVGRIGKTSPAYQPLHGLVSLAEREFEAGERMCRETESGDSPVYRLSRALRAYTRAQVRAVQTYQALSPAPDAEKREKS